MNQDQAIDLMNRMLWEAMIIAGPLLAAVLFVGLLISVFQATTQLQEMTLSYVPKMLVSGLLLIFLGPWMIGRMVQFALGLIRCRAWVTAISCRNCPSQRSTSGGRRSA